MKLEKAITKDIVNESDKTATRALCRDINEADNAITVDLFDESGNQIAHKRVYNLDDMPFSINTGEKELVAEKEPSDIWKVDTIKLWLDSKQTKDEDGKVVTGDPYKYNADAVKSELLEIVKPKAQIQ